MDTDDDLIQEIQQVFAEVTRYPIDILELDAHLEEDLGIDSVKLGEIFAVLRSKYHLPEQIDAEPEQFSTINHIAALLSQYLLNKDVAIASQAGVSFAQASVEREYQRSTFQNLIQRNSHDNCSAKDSLLNEVISVFAEVTRYPVDILEPNAHLEEDLGIDSVKLGEIFAVLRSKYDLPEKLEAEPEAFSSIHKITYLLNNYIEGKDIPLARPEIEDISIHEQAFTKDTAVSFPSTNNVSQQGPLFNHSLKGKLVFISGSGHGLGKDIAVYLAGMGATVIINSFHSRSHGEETAEEIRSNGGKAHHIWGSVANKKHIDAIFDEIELKYGGLDFFIANASNGILAKLEDITAEKMEKAFKTNVVGLHLSALRARELMKKRGGGKIITMSSPAAHHYIEYFACMGAVKMAVESLTKSMAFEFASDNIQVTCVSPGPVMGDLLQKWPESERLIKDWEEATAFERLCEARDVSQLIGYLLNESVKLFTGNVIVMDGGLSSRQA